SRGIRGRRGALACRRLAVAEGSAARRGRGARAARARLDARARALGVERARDELEEVLLGAHALRAPRVDGVPVLVRERFVLRSPVRDERGEDPADELVGDDLVRARKPGLGEILGEFPVEEVLLVVERLRVADRALDEELLELGIR